MTLPIREETLKLKKKVESFIDQINKDSSSKEEILKQVSGTVKFAIDPLEYGLGAIACLEEQLTRVRSPRKKLRLESRLADWQKRVDILSKK